MGGFRLRKERNHDQKYDSLRARRGIGQRKKFRLRDPLGE
jgi:hypothetical protein